MQSIKCNGKTSHFILNESNLGKAEFFQVDFSSFDEVNIINIILIESLFVNTTWGNNINSFAGDQMEHYKKDRIFSKNLFKKLKLKIYKSKVYYNETKEHLKNKREVYKQIKYTLPSQFYHRLLLLLLLLVYHALPKFA